jgi:hypothetical protein
MGDERAGLMSEENKGGQYPSAQSQQSHPNISNLQSEQWQAYLN